MIGRDRTLRNRAVLFICLGVVAFNSVARSQTSSPDSQSAERSSLTPPNVESLITAAISTEETDAQSIDVNQIDSGQVESTQTPSFSNTLTPTALETIQREQQIRESVEKSLASSGTLRDVVQESVNDTFGRTIDLLNLLITVLIAIPVLTGLGTIVLRRTIIDQLVREIKKQIKQETEKEVQTQLEIQVNAELQKQIEAFQQELEASKVEFVEQLQQLFLTAQSEKDQIVQELSTITPSLIQEELIPPEIEQKIRDLTQQLQSLKSANPRLALSAADYVQEGDALYFERRYEAAIAAYDKAIQIKPNDFSAWHGKAKALGRQGQPTASLVCNDKTIELQPENAVAWFGRGYVLRTLKRYEEALEAYETVLQLRPDWYRPWNHQAYVLIKLGRLAEALESLEKARSLNPDSIGYHYTRAYYDLSQGYGAGAIANLERVLNLYADHKSHKSMNYRDELKTDPDFRGLRDHPEFQALLRN